MNQIGELIAWAIHENYRGNPAKTMIIANVCHKMIKRGRQCRWSGVLQVVKTFVIGRRTSPNYEPLL